MRQKFTTLALALTLVAGFAGTVDAQQTPRDTTAQTDRVDDDDDDGMDLGWIGLLGLAGLLGLRRREDVRPIVRTDASTRTDTAYPNAPR